MNVLPQLSLTVLIVCNVFSFALLHNYTSDHILLLRAVAYSYDNVCQSIYSVGLPSS